MIGILGSEEAFYYQYGTQFSASDACLVSRECLKRIRDNTVPFNVVTEEQCEEVALTLQHKDCFFKFAVCVYMVRVARFERASSTSQMWPSMPLAYTRILTRLVFIVSRLTVSIIKIKIAVRVFMVRSPRLELGIPCL